MADPINDWRQTGVVHLWRYKPEKSGLRGWHFTGDEPGLQSTAKLLELLRAAAYPAKRTVNLTNLPSASGPGHFHHSENTKSSRRSLFSFPLIKASPTTFGSWKKKVSARNSASGESPFWISWTGFGN